MLAALPSAAAAAADAATAATARPPSAAVPRGRQQPTVSLLHAVFLFLTPAATSTAFISA